MVARSRFVQLYMVPHQQNVDTWDAHASIVDNHGQHAAEVDKPIAGDFRSQTPRAAGRTLVIDSELTHAHFPARD
jgi:hypothetical protein